MKNQLRLVYYPYSLATTLILAHFCLMPLLAATASEEPFLIQQEATKDSIVPTAQKDLPRNNASITVGSINDNSNLLSYLLVVPCKDWQTNLITLTGQMQPQMNQQVQVQANQIDTNSTVIDFDLLKEYGCQLRAKRILKRGPVRIIAEGYQFPNVAAAFGAYCAAHKGSSNFLPSTDASSEDQSSISFCKDQYFICLYSSDPDDSEAKAAITDLTHKLTEKFASPNNIQGGFNGKGQPPTFNSMPVLERLKGSEKLVMGPIGLKRFFPAPYSANLAPLIDGSIADYKFDEPDRDRLKLLIANYPTAQQANSVFMNYTSTLRNSHSEKSADGFAYPTALFKVSDSFLLCQLRDKQIIVINGARHKESPAQLAHQIYTY